jgi:hypothetical protein
MFDRRSPVWSRVRRRSRIDDGGDADAGDAVDGARGPKGCWACDAKNGV